MVLLIDNYDSFVYNLSRYVGELGFDRLVKRNDAITIEEIKAINPSHIIISPGPCTPNEAGISLNLIQQLGPKIPILGVCLGHQAIGQIYGGKIVRAKKPMHGKTSCIKHNGKKIFQNVENPLLAGRYHSLVISKEQFPNDLEILAWSDDNEIMAVMHKKYWVFGLQFHPESILTLSGYDLLKNFLIS